MDTQVKQGDTVRCWMNRERLPNEYEEGEVLCIVDGCCAVSVDRSVTDGVEQNITGEGVVFPMSDEVEVL